MSLLYGKLKEFKYFSKPKLFFILVEVSSLPIKYACFVEYRSFKYHEYISFRIFVSLELNADCFMIAELEKKI